MQHRIVKSLSVVPIILLLSVLAFGHQGGRGAMRRLPGLLTTRTICPASGWVAPLGRSTTHRHHSLRLVKPRTQQH